MDKIYKPDVVLEEVLDSDGRRAYDLHEVRVRREVSYGTNGQSVSYHIYRWPLARIKADRTGKSWDLFPEPEHDELQCYLLSANSPWKVYRRFRKLFRRRYPLGFKIEVCYAT